MFETYQFIIARALPPIIATLIGVAVIMLFDRREPLIVEALTIAPSPARVGETAYVIFQAQKRRTCDGVVRRWVEDSANTIFTFAPEPAAYAELLPGDKRQFVKQFVVPLGMAPGPAIYHTDVERWCNFMQETFWPMHDSYSATFTVAAVPGGGNAPAKPGRK